jgi:phosphatidylserine/phosphatidylglycerophosphate/cardiolipin synthase-like enzyme
MHECTSGEYWFYHVGSYPSDTPALYQQVIDSATREIIIWDPYFNVTVPNSDQNIFMNIRDNITIKILTYKGLDKNVSYLTDIQNALRMIIPKSKDCRFGLRLINKGDAGNQRDRFFHDRFLIIDDNDVYLVGSSVGHHVNSFGESTGMFKILNDKTNIFIKSIFQYYWANSSKYEIPVGYLHI